MYQRFALLLCLCLLQLFSRGQEFSHYTHLITSTPHDNLFMRGAFCLVKHGRKTYLVTCAHVINGWDQAQNKPERTATDTMILQFRKTDGSFKFFQISTKQFKKNPSHASYHLVPDLFIASISLPADIVIESIDSFMNVDYIKITPVRWFSYGFPRLPSPKPPLDQMLRTMPQLSAGEVIGDFQAPGSYFDTVTKKKGMDYVTYNANADNIAGQGFSGAPAFLQDANEQTFFGGICSAGAPNSHFMVMVRPELIKDIILKNAKSIPKLLIFPYP
jgi:hypothetical protein